MASGFTTLTNEHLIRTDIWSRQMKQLLLDDLQAMRWVRMVEDFTDGTTLHIPSLGEAETSDFIEGQSVKYNKMDTGQFNFTHDQYKYSAHSMSEKFKRDSFYSAEVLASFPQRQHRALMEAVETRVLSRGPAAQTPANLNLINTGPHRFIGSGTAEAIAPVDFSLAKFALRKANVPMTNLVAVVDPTVTHIIETQTNLVNLLSPMPMAEDIYKNSAITGLRFRYNIFGFDVYESNYLPTGFAETIDGKTTTNAVANQFFSAAGGDVNPIIGSFRQMPTVHHKFEQDLQEDRYMTICEYGFALYRPENMVVVLTDLDVV